MEQTTRQISFTKDEAQVLLNLVNDAIKAVGYGNAENGAYMIKKIDNAFKPTEEELKSVEKKTDEKKN